MDLGRWFIRDAVWRNRGKVIAILASQVAALGLQILALLLIVEYLQFLQDGGGALGTVLPSLTPTSPVSVLVVALLTIGLVAASGSFQYLAGIRTIHLRRLHEQFCAARALYSFSRVQPTSLDGAPSLPDSKLVLRTVRKDSRNCGRVLGLAVGTVVPVGVLCAALGALLYFQPWLTVVFGFVVAGLARSLSSINRSGARATRAMEQASSEAAAEVRAAIGRLRTDRNVGLETEWFQEWIGQSPGMARYLDAFEGRLAALQRAGFVSYLALSAMLLTFFLALSLTLFGGEGDIGHVAFVVFILLKGATGFRQLNTKMASMNRFYPSVQRYRAFVEEAEDTPSLGPVKQPLAVRLGRAEVIGSDSLVHIGSGERLLVLPVDLNKTDPCQLLAALDPSPSVIPHFAACVQIGRAFPPGWSVPWEEPGSSEVPARRAFESTEDSDAARGPADDAALSATEATATPAARRFLRECRSVAGRSASNVFVNLRTVAPFPADVLEAGLGILNRHRVIIGSPSTDVPAGLRDYGTSVAVLRDREVVGLGSLAWFVGVANGASIQLPERYSRPDLEDDVYDEDDDDL